MVEDGADGCEEGEGEMDRGGRKAEGVSSNLSFRRAKTVAEEPRSRSRA